MSLQHSQGTQQEDHFGTVISPTAKILCLGFGGGVRLFVFLL